MKFVSYFLHHAQACVFCAALLLPLARAGAQWSGDNTVNTPICTATGNQANVRMAKDGSGGAYIVWVDARNVGNNYDIYMQRLDQDGYAQWAANGIPLVSLPNNQLEPEVLADGSGGMYVAWVDDRTEPSDLYVQRVNADGDQLWNTDGTTVGLEHAGGGDLELDLDSSGKLIITWTDAASADIYMQRYTPATGAEEWTAGGVLVATADWIQKSPTTVLLSGGGFMVAWEDQRAGNNGYDIYARYVNSSGVPQGAAPGGTRICSGLYDQRDPIGVANTSDEALFVWRDFRNPGPDFQWDLYGEKVTTAMGLASGSPSGNISFCTNPYSLSRVFAGPDGAGGLMAVWEDLRNNTLKLEDAFAAQMNQFGTMTGSYGGANGTDICSDDAEQLEPTFTADGSGHLVFAWVDRRGFQPRRIYARRLSQLKVNQYTPSFEVCVSDPVSGNVYEPAIVPGGGPSGSAIIAWRDSRNTGQSFNTDIYAARVFSDGVLPVGISGFELE